MAERRTYPKSTCCVPGCPRWSRKFPGEWVCARHWKAMPARCRRALRKTWRRLDEMWATFPRNEAWSADQCRTYDRVRLVGDRLWAHGKRAAILREAGL